MPAKYKVLRKRVLEKKTEAEKGDIVYKCILYDYGCASMDTRGLGVEHISVTKDKDGGYPFFTIPVEDLERLQ